MKIKLLAFLYLFVLSINSCSTPIEEYKTQTPHLKFESFFNGNLLAHGYFKDRNNKVIKRFVVEMKANWINDICILEELFSYSDGTKSKRIWTIKKISDNNYEGTASDVVGKAVGQIAGNTLYWKYDLLLAVDKNEYKVHFEDWMYLIDENTLINQSYMSKFGISLGEVVLNIRKIN